MLRSVSIQRLTVTQVLTVSRASHVTNRYKNFHRLLSTQTVEKVDFHGTDKLRFQDSVIGHLSEASVVGSIGGTVVHVAINSQHNDKAEDYFLPLTVDYRTRNYATGKIPLARTKRESHNSEEDTLVARFIDRAIRPLFPKGYVNEVQVIATTHAADGVYDPTVVAVNATSYALMKSKQPWRGPVGCVRVGLIDGQLKINPSVEEMNSSKLDFLYAGTDKRTLMIETIASEISEEQLKEAIELAHKEVQNIIKEQLGCLQIGDKSIDSTNEFSQDVVSSSSIAAIAYNGFDLTADLKAVAMRMAYDRAYAVYFTPDETDMISIGDRSRSEGKLRAELLREIESVTEFNDQHLIIRQLAVDYVMNKAFRDAVLTNGKRVDGRTTTKLREISSYSDVLPTVHGSSYFKRGDTHVLCTTTLGPKSEAKSLRPINGMREDSEEYFFLHYDFPPYCTGELGLASGMNRRMIGHGNLAERALRPVMPSIHIFPYTVRLFAECTSSNGSSSMASACAATLALMDAGVPISSPVAGVSVGLITDDSSLQSSTTGDGATVDTYSNYKLLKDILGSEDHHGDMDFKIAGTTTGVTAIQLDVKLDGGVPLSLLIEALEVARLGRLEILESINQCIPQHRSTVKPHAPHAAMIQFNPEMIEAVLGQRGQIIKLIQEKCDCEIDTTEEGEAYVFGSNADLVQEAKELIEDLVMTVKENDTATAEVVDVKDFGVVVKVNRAKEGILHISQFSHDPQITHVQLPELLQIGMKFPVKITFVDDASGLIKVSRKQLLDPKTSVPDPLMFTKDSAKDESVGAVVLPRNNNGFPTVPPRKFSKDFFRLKVASKKEIKIAEDKLESPDTSIKLKSYTNASENASKKYNSHSGNKRNISDKSSRDKRSNSNRSNSKRSSRSDGNEVTSAKDLTIKSRDNVDSKTRHRSPGDHATNLESASCRDSEEAKDASKRNNHKDGTGEVSNVAKI